MAAAATDRNLASDPLCAVPRCIGPRRRWRRAREVLATMRSTDGSGAGPRLAAGQIAWREDRVRDGNRYARSGRFEFARYKTPEDLGRDDES